VYGTEGRSWWWWWWWWWWWRHISFRKWQRNVVVVIR